MWIKKIIRREYKKKTNNKRNGDDKIQIVISLVNFVVMPFWIFTRKSIIEKKHTNPSPMELDVTVIYYDPCWIDDVWYALAIQMLLGPNFYRAVTARDGKKMWKKNDCRINLIRFERWLWWWCGVRGLTHFIRYSDFEMCMCVCVRHSGNVFSHCFCCNDPWK